MADLLGIGARWPLTRRRPATKAKMLQGYGFSLHVRREPALPSVHGGVSAERSSAAASLTPSATDTVPPGGTPRWESLTVARISKSPSGVSWRSFNVLRWPSWGLQLTLVGTGPVSGVKRQSLAATRIVVKDAS